jgi:hypothetical protein
MPSKKDGNHPSKNSLERKAWASESAVSFVTGAVMEANTIAVQCIERMLMEMYLVVAWLEENGFDREQFAVSTHCFAQLKYCLSEVGPCTTINAVEALHGFWLHGGAHEQYWPQYFMAAGLEELAKECFRVIQDAIAMRTILFPETFQQIIDMGIGVDLMSKLRHAHFIAKRHVGGVGERLSQMGELPANSVTKKAMQKTAVAQALAVHTYPRAKDWLAQATARLWPGGRARPED